MKGGISRMSKVVVYTKNICPGCSSVKGWLEGNGVEFEVRNVEDGNKEVAQKNKDAVFGMGFQAVPVTVVEGAKPIVGFNVPELEKALGL